VSLKVIDRFEKQNPEIAVNMLGYENSVYPLRISKFKRNSIMNLLLEKHYV